MDQEEISPSFDEQPDFYQTVLKENLTAEQLENTHNIIEVDDIDEVLIRAQLFSDCEILGPKSLLFADEWCAVLKCPNGNILIITQRIKLEGL